MQHNQDDVHRGPPPYFSGPPPAMHLQEPSKFDGPPPPLHKTAENPSIPSLMSMNVENPESCDEPKLPQALEQALAFKSERAKAIGVTNEENAVVEKSYDEPRNAMNDQTDSNADGQNINKKDLETKNKRKKKRKKKNRREIQEQIEKKINENEEKNGEEPDVEIEYIQEVLGIDDLDPLHKQFARIFELFKIVEPETKKDTKNQYVSLGGEPRLRKIIATEAEIDPEEEEEKALEDGKPKLSKRKLKKLTRLSVAELKQLVPRPDVVEMHDVTARDPKLLVHLKSHRNTVPVPRHWCFKRKYLQGKRGIEKPPFDLPDFIKRTGIMEMRAALTEKEDSRTLKAKMRERIRPKLGKIDIDYQKLHDAFFKWQTKPRLTIHGDLYYEGKEFETKLKEKKPGDLSSDLRLALGMPVGHGAHKVPPPWLIAMQRYGPPPSYPNLKIPGLNAPIPDGCSFGYHAGGWGKPPVDETGRPLYGDVFGTQGGGLEGDGDEEEVDRTQWGELESESEGSDEEEEEDEQEEEGEDNGAAGEKDESGLVTPAEGLITPSGITSITTGLETPDIIELRKKKIEAEMEGSDTPALYQVLPERRVERIGGSMMGSTHVYDVSAGQPGGVGTGAQRRAPTTANTVELALDPSELDLDSDAMAARYEQQLRQQQNQLQKEDLSDMVAEHVTRQKTKRKRQVAQETNKQTKKYKEFKF